MNKKTLRILIISFAAALIICGSFLGAQAIRGKKQQTQMEIMLLMQVRILTIIMVLTKKIILTIHLQIQKPQMMTILFQKKASRTALITMRLLPHLPPLMKIMSQYYRKQQQSRIWILTPGIIKLMVTAT